MHIHGFIIGKVLSIPGLGPGGGGFCGDGVGVGEASGFLVLDLSLGAVDDFGGMNEIIKCRSRTPTWWGRSSRSGRIILELVWSYHNTYKDTS